MCFKISELLLHLMKSMKKIRLAEILKLLIYLQ